MHPGIYLIIAAEMENKRRLESGRAPDPFGYEDEPRRNGEEGLIGRLRRWLRRDPCAECADAACGCT
jgi:hypothetical protein